MVIKRGKHRNTIGKKPSSRPAVKPVREVVAKKAAKVTKKSSTGQTRTTATKAIRNRSSLSEFFRAATKRPDVDAIMRKLANL